MEIILNGTVGAHAVIELGCIELKAADVVAPLGVMHSPLARALTVARVDSIMTAVLSVGQALSCLWLASSSWRTTQRWVSSRLWPLSRATP